MHFSSFCTTNYVPLERFGYNLHETVSLKPLGLFFCLQKVLKNLFLKNIL